MFVVSWMKEKSSNTLFSDDNNFTLFSRKLHDKWREILQFFHTNWSFSILRNIRDVIQWRCDSISLFTNIFLKLTKRQTNFSAKFLGFIDFLHRDRTMDLKFVESQYIVCRVLMFFTVRSWSINLDGAKYSNCLKFLCDWIAKCLESTDILESVCFDVTYRTHTCQFGRVILR